MLRTAGIIALVAVIGFAVSATFAACGDDGGGGGNTPGGGTVSKETISAKWTIRNSANSTFEFTPDSIYVVVGDFGQPASRVYVYTGTYTISGNKITLEDFGVLEIKSFSNDEFSFSLKLTDSDESYDYQAIRQDDTIVSSTQTNLLCRFWKVIKPSDMAGTGVLFSKAGTYLVTYTDGSTGLAEWKWKNTEQTTLQYSWDRWEESDEVQIQELTASSLKINEMGDTYELVPSGGN